jgi:hypothetical protein
MSPHQETPAWREIDWTQLKRFVDGYLGNISIYVYWVAHIMYKCIYIYYLLTYIYICTVCNRATVPRGADVQGRHAKDSAAVNRTQNNQGVYDVSLRLGELSSKKIKKLWELGSRKKPCHKLLLYPHNAVLNFRSCQIAKKDKQPGLLQITRSFVCINQP